MLLLLPDQPPNPRGIASYHIDPMSALQIPLLLFGKTSNSRLVLIYKH